jgi:hypothetical protein
VEVLLSTFGSQVFCKELLISIIKFSCFDQMLESRCRICFKTGDGSCFKKGKDMQQDKRWRNRTRKVQDWKWLMLHDRRWVIFQER